MQKIVYLLSKKRLLWQFRLLIAVCIPIMLAAAGCEKKRAFVLPEEDAAQVSGLSSLPADSVEQNATQSVREEAAPESVLLVHVCGAVVSEGVYNVQNAATQGFISFAYIGIPMISLLLLAFIMIFFRVERH